MEWLFEGSGERLAEAERLRLFLDYDGTLADFAPTPEHVNPNHAVIEVVSALVDAPHIRVAVVSGRRLSHVEALVPVSGALLAGTYGIELRMPEGERVERVDYDAVRPVLDRIKPRWAALIDQRTGFFLEDKGWTLALHARFADEGEAKAVLEEAQGLIDERATADLFRVLGGHKFLEIGPRLAHKGKTVTWLLDRYPWSGALPLYLGDDDKDEEAFEVIQARGGLAIQVASQERETRADGRLPSPRSARQWLGTLV